MKYLDKYVNYSINEWSKNDPIPELSERNKLGIFLLGLPGSGKSTFIHNFITPINRNIKKFSTDDISFLYTKNPNQYKEKSSEINIKYVKNYIETGQNFIYDSTGANDIGIRQICEKAINNDYKIIFILILVDLETAIIQNIKRGNSGGHLVDEDYIKYVYSIQNRTTKDYINNIKHSGFYIALRKSNSYKFLKIENNEIKKRKMNKYISFKNPIHLMNR